MSTATSLFSSFDLNTDRYVSLLSKLISETEHLQNNPAMELIPEENRASDHCLALLLPHAKENGGCLEIERVEFIKGRGNVIITYPSATTSTACVSFVGSHLDVVPASRDTWKRDPFTLTVEGDCLYGRGTTDCLGHVALLTELFLHLSEKKPKLPISIHAVFIASEENDSIKNVGVDEVMKTGKMDKMKNGPLFWVDCSDSHPCVGTASAITWTLEGRGKLFHSGLPHKGINAIELVSDALLYIQNRFYADHQTFTNEEQKYKFMCPSTLKPTQIRCAKGSLNQIPASATVQGDIRLTPFYDTKDTIKKLKSYVNDLNNDINCITSTHRGPCSKYSLEGEMTGSLVLSVDEDSVFEGIACSLDSPGFHALHNAIMKIKGVSNPFSVCGSLPLVCDLQAAGFDVQLIGFGLSSAYHADNEYCKLSDMKDGFKILCCVIDSLCGHKQ